MRIADRIKLYKSKFSDCRAIKPVKEIYSKWVEAGELERLELLRELNTQLSDLYMVSIPVITVWVRDDNYVKATGEIYLTEPELGGFLHQFRHHLQNVERKYERRGLTAEGKMEYSKLPYEDCLYKMLGEDDAIAWARFLVEVARE